MSDRLERWLEDVEGRHRQNGQGECRYCYGRGWPCDAAQAARVIRAQAKALEIYADELQYSDEKRQRFAALLAATIEGKDK